MEKKLVCFIVVGRMGKSLVVSKAEPFLYHHLVGKIFIFCETAGSYLNNTEYITLPSWMVNLKPLFLYRFFRTVYEPFQLIYYSLKLKPDFINGYHLIPKGLNSLLAARLTGSKCVISVIGGIIEIETYSRFKWLLKRVNLYALRQADLVTTKGSVVNAYLADNKIPSSKVVVYNGSINLGTFYFDPEVKKDIDVLFVGSFSSLKGPDRVLRILDLLKKRFPLIKACLIGNGSLFASSVELCRSLGLTGNVQFTGRIENPAKYYQRSRILILPSTSEGLPTSMLEAMACGCVPVISDVGNIKDIAVQGENAFLINGYMNFSSFAQSITLLLSDEELQSRMANNGILTVRESFSEKHQADIVDNMIKKLFN